MRIAFVITNYTDSTIALAKELSERGENVDVYLVKFKKGDFEDTGIEFYTKSRKYGCIYELNYNTSKGVCWVNNKGSHVYVYQSFPTGEKSKGLKSFVVRHVFELFIKRFCSHLKNREYDCIDIMTPIPQLDILNKYLKGQNLLRSFHEVLSSHLERNDLLKSVTNAIEEKIPIRVFSEKSANDIFMAVGNSHEIQIVPFGLYYSFKEFGGIKIEKVENFGKFILFYGAILPYKGLSILYDSIMRLRSKGVMVKTVVAGKGYDDCLPKIEADDSFLLINRFLSNDEIAYLIDRSVCVVCPYLSVSQSGIPQTVFPFDRPIIASKIGTFKDLIIQNITGMLVRPNCVEDLVDSIERVYEDPLYVENMNKQILNFEQLIPKYSWDKICTNYIEIIHKLFS